MINLTPQWLRRVSPGNEVYLMIPRSLRVLLLCGMAYGKRDPQTEQIAFLTAQRSNCIFYALRRWLGPVEQHLQRYLLVRRSRINWGVCHVLYGVTAPNGQVTVWSYKPPPNHQKPGVRPVFHGRVVEGDAP